MTRLDSVLARALTTAPVSASERAALGSSAIDGGNAVILGRLLRLGLLSSSERAAVEKFPADAVALEGAANAELDHGSPSAPLDVVVAARDVAESVLVLLGVLGAEDAERRLFARVTKVDEAMLLRRDEWSAFGSADAWLTRLAALDASTWWLDLVALGSLRARLGAAPLAQAFRDGPQPSAVSLRRSARTSPAERRLYAEVVGMDDDPARVAVERGAVIARLFDGAIEVFAVGLRADHEDLAAGLCVVGPAEIERVEIRGVDAALGGKSASGWWIPLPADLMGPQELVVRYAGRDETLALDITLRAGQ